MDRLRRAFDRKHGPEPERPTENQILERLIAWREFVRESQTTPTTNTQ